MSVCIIAQTTYYVNIDNAPNGSANGTMEAIKQGWSESAPIVWVENYNGGRGGKYKSEWALPRSTSLISVTVKCTAKKRWDLNTWLYGYSEQTFTGGSSSYLPTIHIENPQTTPVNPPYPH